MCQLRITSAQPASSSYLQPQQYQGQHPSRGRGISRVVIPSYPPGGLSGAEGPETWGRGECRRNRGTRGTATPDHESPNPSRANRGPCFSPRP